MKQEQLFESPDVEAVENLNLEDLTTEELEALEELAVAEAARREEVREQLGKVLIKHRDDAVTYRSNSGIEQQWAEDQAYYEGLDETGKTMYYKGTSGSSPLIAKPKNAYRSKVFINITRAYCEAAASKVIEVLTPTDTQPWSLEPSSIPNLPEKPSPLVVAVQAALPQGQEAAPTPAQPNPLEEALKIAKEACRGAELWIKDKLDQSSFTFHTRTLIDEAARLGTGVIRGPFPTMRKSRKVNGNGELEILEEILPESRYISVWDAYPDPACGDNIHDGQFFIEHDSMVERQVLALKEQPGYDADAIDKVIEAGPTSGSATGVVSRPFESNDKSAKRYDVWYYYGFITLEEARSMQCDCQEDDVVANTGVPVVVTMINNTPVKTHLNPLTDGYFPYEFMCWQRVAGSPFGIGVARQIRSCQAILNANVRAMMENAGLSSGPQIIVARGAVVPADGKWEIVPRKVWILKADSDVQDVNQAMSAFQVPSVQVELLQAVDFALKMAENVTGLPVLMQGQQGSQGVPETVGGMQILVANASSLLRRMARIYDDFLVKPHIQAYYNWMMLYSDDQSIKGDFKVVARGSSALIERDKRNQFLTQTVPQLMVNPAYGIDPTRLFKELAKVSGLENPEAIMFSPEELKALQEAQAQVQDPKLQVAQLNAETKLKVAEMDNQTTQQRIAVDTDRDTAYVQAEAMRTQVTAEIKMAELQMRERLAMLEYANREKITLDQLKTQIAIEAGKHDLARELATLPTVKDVAKGLQEPYGKAPDGLADHL